MNTEKVTKTQIDLDLTVFETIGTECFGSRYFVDIKGCDHIIRLVLALNYYEALQQSNDVQHRLFLIEFIKSVYDETQVLNDWVHFMSVHSHQIEDIHNVLVDESKGYGGGCKKGMESCTFFHRHYDGDRRGKHLIKGMEGTEKEEGNSLVFFSELFDRVHHFLYHLFDSGMRTKREVIDAVTMNVDNDNVEGDDNSTNGEQRFVDKEFAARRKALNERREKLKSITDRYDEKKNNKFNIATAGDGDGNGTNTERKPFMDALFEMLFGRKFPWKTIQSLQSTITSQEYDTDALVENVAGDATDSNLIGNGVNNDCDAVITRFVQESKRTLYFVSKCSDSFTKRHWNCKYPVSPMTFSTGITWFYWDSYKEKIPQDPFALQNPNDYGGYSATELFVKRRYENYKEEILQHIPMEQYQTMVVEKVEKYLKTDRVRAMKMDGRRAPDVFRYGLKGGDPIKHHHITSIVLYCDFTVYCSEFSAGYRFLDRWETIESAKRRHSEYYWQGKHFRETVEAFGFPYDEYYVEYGPFFCGVDRVMVIPSFCLRLRGPTSTSKQLEVAMNFAKDDGMIIELNNNAHYLARYLPFFDCSWLSNFADEDERIWCGGWMTIRLESIRHVSNNRNYQAVVQCLFVLDSMLSGAAIDAEEMGRMLLNKRERDLLFTLMINDSSSAPPDQYVIDLFTAYRKHKALIKIIWVLFTYQFQANLRPLVAHSTIEECKPSKMDTSTKSVNLLSPSLLKVFCYTEHIVIATYGKFYFDLVEFAKMICDGSWKRITIEDAEEEWIVPLWKSEEKQRICDLYSQKAMQIDLEIGTMLFGDEEGNIEEHAMNRLIITRL